MTSLDSWISENIPDVVMDDAAAWMARLDSSTCTPADRLSFARWLAEDPTHRWAFEELSAVWARLRTLSDVGEQVREQSRGDKVVPFPLDTTAGYPAGEAPRARDTGRSWSMWAAGALIGLAILTNVLTSEPKRDWQTGAGETLAVVLDDGSALELNGKTRVSVRLDERYRLVELAAGEAVFDVAADDRPFIVRTDNGEIAALGTVFSVDAQPDQTEVAVIEGRVAIRATGAGVALSDDELQYALDKGISRATLAAGQYAELAADRVRSRIVAPGAIERSLSWREGRVHFEAAPLGNVLDEMQRYTDLSIHIGSPVLDDVRVSGEFSTRDIDGFLSRLSSEYGVDVDHGGQGWVVLRAPGNLQKN